MSSTDAAAAMRRVVRVTALATLVAVPVATLVGLAVAGVPGLWGGLLGTLVPAVFLGLTAVSGVLTARLNPQTLGIVVLGTWTLKVLLLIGALAALRGADFYSRGVFLVAFVVGTAGVLLVEGITVKNTRQRYVEPAHTVPGGP